MAAPPPGQVEAGVPSFTVFGTEVTGLQHSPTGLHLLPDGRLLVTAPGELAFTDGVRWEVFRAQDGEPMMPRQALVDNDGTIYLAVPGAIGRVEFGSDGFWRTRPVVPLPAGLQTDTMSSAVRLGRDWYWLGGGGSFIRWRPGTTPSVVPNQTTVERLFTVDGALYASEQTSGGLFCLSRNGERVTSLDRVTSSVITAAVPFDVGSVLVATGATGTLRLFDGTNFSPFGASTLIGAGSRINDLCAISPDVFAAAVDTRGIVFFNRRGEVLQVLDAKLDHRLARVQRLLYTNNGVLWALLAEGVARVQYPSRISRFEPILPAGLNYVAPVRHDGTLWLLADGSALRGEYDQTRRLSQFVVDNPPGSFVFTLSTANGDLFAGTDRGIFVRRPGAWRAVATGIINPRIGFARTRQGDLIYAARGEVGTLSKTPDGYIVHRVPVAGLGDNYGAEADAHGIAWIELGATAIGRLDPDGPQPAIKVYGTGSGLPQGWPSVFIFNGAASVAMPQHLYRFDPVTDRFAEDVALEKRFPQFMQATARPEQAPDGRVWYVQDGATWILDPAKPSEPPRKVDMPFAPLEYTFEQGGVVWLRGDRRFARYDPRVPVTSAGKLRAVITSVQFPNSNRQIFDLGRLDSIPFADNTLVFRFAAPGNPFDSSVTFQVELEGQSTRWVPVGNNGQAIFNRLKEGQYEFRVRAIDASGATSEPARLAFRIAPPWFRSGLAWGGYFVLGLGALALSTWYPARRQRRHNQRLEAVVAQRTDELKQANRQLATQIEETTQKSTALEVSEEKYRLLNAELERRVIDRTAELSRSNEDLREAQQKLAATYKELVDASRLAGMAEVATSVLHNVGNVLNSVNVSANLIGETARSSKAETLRRLSCLLDEHRSDLATFLSEDPKGKRVAELVRGLAEAAVREREALIAEVSSLQTNIDHIKEIVAMQQSYATTLGLTEKLDPAALFEDAIRMTAAAMSRHSVRLVREFAAAPVITVEKGKVLQILVNLLQNAKFACTEFNADAPREKVVTARIESADGIIRFIVRDNGVGIRPENLTRIFALGFTTRADGHGFGLHSSALAAREMKGSLTAESAGPGLGATFTLQIPAS